MPFAEIQAGDQTIKTYYEQNGQSSPDIVLVHGLSYDHTCWASQVAALSASSRVTTYDLPGHGQSQEPAGPFTFDVYIEHLAHLLTYLKIQTVIVSGHSMGGSIILQFAGTEPKAHGIVVNGIVVVDSELPDPSEKVVAQTVGPLIKKYGLAFLMPYFQNIFYSLNFQAAEAEVVTAWQAQFITNVPDNVIAALNAWANRSNPVTSGISCPALVLTGVEDNFVGVAKSQILAAAIPNCQLMLIANSGHLTLQEQPASVSLALQQVLEEATARAKGAAKA
jgi:3-oxoadipate enol-lactonase